MTEPSSPTQVRRRWPRRLLWLAAVLVAAAAVAVGGLPSLLSSTWVRELARERASQVLQRNVTLEGFRVTWGGELSLRGLRVPDAPRFSPAPLLALERLDLRIEPWGLLRGRLDLDLALEGLEARFVRDADGHSNLEALLAAFGPESQTAPEPPGAPPPPFALPFTEVSVRVRVSRVTLEAEDRAAGRHAAIRDARLALDLPALGAPITLEAGAGLSVDGEDLAPLSLRLRAERWLRPGGTLDLGGLLAEAGARLPGAELDLKADLPAARATGRVRLDLAELLDFGRPFLPSDLAANQVAGSVELDVEGLGQPGEPVDFGLTLRAQGLAVSGPLLQGRAVGPVALGLEVEGRADPKAGDFSADRGELRLQEGTRATWSGRASGLGSPEAAFEASLGPVALDLGELLALATPFLSPEIRFSLNRATLSLRSLTAAGAIPSPQTPGGRHPVVLDGLGLALGGFRAEAGDAVVEGGGFTLGVERLEVDLVDLFPSRVALQASLRADRLEAFGAQKVTVEGLEVPALRVLLEDLRQVPGSPGLAGRGTVEEAVSVARVHLPSAGALRDLSHAARLACTVGEGGEVQAELGGLRVSVAHAEVARPGLDAALSGLDLRFGKVTVAGARLSGAALAGQVPVAVDDFAFDVTEVRARAGESEVVGADLAVSLPVLTAALRDGFPRDVNLLVSLGAERLDVTGPASARVAGLRVSELELRATELGQSEGALCGVAGRVSLREALAAESLEADPHGGLTGLRHSLRLEAELATGPEVRVSAGGLELEAVDARARIPDRGELRTPLRAAVSWESALLAGPGEPRVDVTGLTADAAAAEWVRLDLAATAKGSGKESLTTRGSARVDLPGVLQALPSGLWQGTSVGAARVDWVFDGRLPSDEELQGLTADLAALAAGRPLAFLRDASASLTLEGVAVDMALEGGQRVGVAGVSTEEPLSFSVRRSGREVALGGAIGLGWIEALPGAGEFAEPLRARLSFRGERGAEGVLRLSQSLAVEPLSLTQGVEVTVAGLDRVLRRGLDTPPALWLNLLSGQARATLRVGESPDLGLVTRDVVLQGPLEAGVALSLARGEEVSGAGSLRADGAGVRLGDRLALEGLRADVAVEKRYRLGTSSADGVPGATFLSEALVRSEAPGRSLSASLLGPVRFGGGSTLGFDSLRATGGPVPLEVTGLDLAFGLPGGLPSVDRFALGTLGGFLVGSLEVARPAEGPGFVLGTRATFTGLDAARLAPGAVLGLGDDTELSGRFSLRFPVATELPAVLSGAEVEAELTHVGSRVLDRALYALDPSESNEAVVKQRRLVRLGGPRWVRVGVRNGNLSLAGEVEAAGIRLQLPRLERFNVAAVPGVEAFGEGLAGLGPVIRALEALSAQTLEIDEAGAVRFRHGGEP